MFLVSRAAFMAMVSSKAMSETYGEITLDSAKAWEKSPKKAKDRWLEMRVARHSPQVPWGKWLGSDIPFSVSLFKAISWKTHGFVVWVRTMQGKSRASIWTDLNMIGTPWDCAAHNLCI